MATLKLNSYELFSQSSNNRPVYGSGVPAGTIVQVQHTQFTGTANTGSISAGTRTVLFDSASSTEILNVTIKPQFQTSTIWLQCMWCGEHDGDSPQDSMFGFKRGTTDLSSPLIGSDTSRTRGIAPPTRASSGSDAGSTMEACYFQYFDSPNTTNQILYKTTIINGGNITIYTNRTKSFGNNDGNEQGISSIVAMEIAA